MKKAIIILSILLGYLLTISAQGVKIGDNTNAADASAMLDVESTNKGVLHPRMTDTQRNAIASPATGLLIFQTNNGSGFYYFNGIGWIPVFNGTWICDLTASTTASGGTITANYAGGTPPYNYLWDGSASGETTSTVTGMPPGTYNVTVTDVNGCTATSSTVEIVPPVLVIGDPYQGGIIFYLDGNGGGLIAALSHQYTVAEWGCYGTNVAGADQTGLFQGSQNTIDIFNTNCSPNTIGNLIAANFCANLILDGYSDWFLPSKDELNLMYQNIGQGNALGLGNIGGFADSYYWSSTESPPNHVWTQDFTFGLQSIHNKFYSNSVRAVRAF